MPYYIEQNHPECKSGWAVTDGGEGYYGCHTTKASAIKQAVAISLNTDEPFEGERAALDELMIGDWVSWDVLNPEIAAVIVDIQQDQALLGLYDYEDGIFEQTDKVMILNIFRLVKIARPEMVAEEIPHQDEMPQPEDPIEPAVFEMATRAINQEAPAYMRAAARRGLEYYADGLGGDGLVERTIDEARDMAEGRVSDDKWIRIAAWIARHLGDLDSPDANPESDNYPSAGVVAHLLWGSGPSKASARRALDYAESVVARIRTEQESERMTEPTPTVKDLLWIESRRDAWLSAAWKIKAKLEGTTYRSLEGAQIRASRVELRAEGDGRTFSGYASVFNEPSLPLPFTEIVKPGAFKRSLQSRNRIMLLWNHDTSNPLASTRNGSLVLTEDAKGLFVTATLPKTSLGNDIATLVRDGVIDAMSFGFTVRKDSWSHDGSTRYLEDVSLSEVSLVSTPAYEQTSGTVSVRSADGISADALADALLKIESGDELDSEQGALMRDVIERLSKTEATPEPEVEGDLTALYKKKLALAEMGN